MQEKDILYYNTVTHIYGAPQKIDFDIRTNGFVIKNGGNTILIVDDEQLQPGESKSIGGNKGEIFIGRKDISFTVQAGNLTPTFICVVTVKYYVKIDAQSPNYVKEL
jgi:hypothetical protein